MEQYCTDNDLSLKTLFAKDEVITIDTTVPKVDE